MMSACVRLVLNVLKDKGQGSMRLSARLPRKTQTAVNQQQMRLYALLRHIGVDHPGHVRDFFCVDCLDLNICCQISRAW